MKITRKAEICESVHRVLQSNDVKIEEELALKIFQSHIDSLIERLEQGSPLDGIEKDYMGIIEELDESSIDIAEKVVTEVFSKFMMEPTILEMILIATHIQAQKNRKENG